MQLNLTAKQLRQAAALREKIDRLTADLDAILGGAPTPSATAAKATPAPKRKRRFSKETLAKMAAAAKKRWATAKAKGKKPVAA